MKTLIITFEDTNSNTTDKVVEIANTEDNISLLNDFSGSTLAQCESYFEGKGFVEVTDGSIIDGSEWKVWDRPKVAR